jgi:PRC-barrel domain
MMRAAGVWTWVMVAVLLSACGSLRSKPAPEHNPDVTPEPPATTTAPPPMDDGKAEATEPMTPPAVDSQPPPTTGVSPDCVAPAPKVKPVPKPKPVRKETSPQSPTSAVVAEGSPGAAAGSEIKAISVSVMSILGTKVQGPAGEDLGRVVDVLADASGRVRVAIIDFGGFLGVGDRRIAVEWPLLRFNPADPSSVMLSVGRDKLKSMPEYKGADRPQVLMALPAPTLPTAPPSGDGKQ